MCCLAEKKMALGPISFKARDMWSKFGLAEVIAHKEASSLFVLGRKKMRKKCWKVVRGRCTISM